MTYRAFPVATKTASLNVANAAGTRARHTSNSIVRMSDPYPISGETRTSAVPITTASPTPSGAAVPKYTGPAEGFLAISRVVKMPSPVTASVSRRSKYVRARA